MKAIKKFLCGLLVIFLVVASVIVATNIRLSGDQEEKLRKYLTIEINGEVVG